MKHKTLFNSETGEAFSGLSASQIEAKLRERARELDKLEQKLFSRASLLNDNQLSLNDSVKLNNRLYSYFATDDDFWLPNSQEPLNFD